MRPCRPWSPEDLEHLKMLADSNVRVNAIARRLNRTISALRTKASKEGISLVEISIPLL